MGHSEEYLDINISDLHKDVWGTRPTIDFWKEWEMASEEEKNKTWDQLVSMLDSDDDPNYDKEMDDEPETDYNDDMDGDAASALASAGWGTDEDYGGWDSIDTYCED